MIEPTFKVPTGETNTSEQREIPYFNSPSALCPPDFIATDPKSKRANEAKLDLIPVHKHSG